jgi:hypothetical protein
MIKKIQYILIAIIVISVFLFPFVVKVKIDCKSQFGVCPNEINSKLQILNSKSLFQAKNDVSQILKKESLVSNFSTQFKLPNILLVNLLLKKPTFAIKDNQSGKMYSVDREGKVLSEITSTTLPLVVQDGQTSNLFALNIVSGIAQMYGIGYGTISNDTLVVDMPTGVRVIFPLEGDYQALLGAFRLIYAKVTSNYLGIYSQIDMRYKNPVLR